MDPFVADPGWGWWIIGYFFLGGIAAGAYFTATLVDLFGHEEDRPLARIGYWIAFPLIGVCGLFLTVDLDQPLRFWHMLFKSEVVHEALGQAWPWTPPSWKTMTHAPLLKYWSPMSAGSWALLVFSFCSFVAFLGSLWPDGRLARLFRRSLFARLVQLVGCGVGFFVAAYTGALLTATNQPVWSDSTWVASLFLTSAASTGIATLILLAHRRLSPATMARLERADRWVLVLELMAFVLFLVSLGGLVRVALQTWQGVVLVAGTLIFGLLLPLLLNLLRPRTGAGLITAAAVFALVGGFMLRYGIVRTAPQLLAETGKVDTRQVGTAEAGLRLVPFPLPGFSPEAGRVPGEPGADPGNRAGEVRPRSKVFTGP